MALPTKQRECTLHGGVSEIIALYEQSLDGSLFDGSVG
jgi:hypothetical protein